VAPASKAAAAVRDKTKERIEKSPKGRVEKKRNKKTNQNFVIPAKAGIHRGTCGFPPSRE
jgi:hypothetical protein